MDTESCLHLRVELAAAQLAVEWKELFATELSDAAARLAQGAKTVTVDHYRRALAEATERLMQKVNAHRSESAHVYRRIA